MNGSHGSHPASRRAPSRHAPTLLGLAGLALMVMAAVKELRRPPAQRSWQGEVLGVVPYDLRPPTVTRLRASVWQPESERWLLPRTFGVGWSPNVARVVRLVRGRDRGPVSPS